MPVCLLMMSFCAFAQSPAPAVIRIDAGGAAIGSWSADTDFSASQVSTTNAAIVTTLVSNPAPQAVYQSERYGNFTYTIPNLTPGLSYPINLHFAEIYWNASHEREFNVLINDVQVLTNFDIFTEAGGMNVALTRQFLAVASASGTITIQFASGAADLPKVSGIEVMPALEPQAVLNSGAVYTVISNATGQALDDNNTTTPGGVVTQWIPQLGNTNQQWQINAVGNGRFTLVSLSNGLALDNAGSTASGAQIGQNVATKAKTSQVWTITSTGSRAFELKNLASGLVLDTSTSSGNGGTIVQSQATNAPSQVWKIAPVVIGAQTPFVSYEGEAGVLGGGATVVSLTTPPATEFTTPQLEASGRAFAQLTSTGQSVSWTNNTGHAITAINVRYSIPDAPNGGGITSTLDLYVNGTLRQALNVNSKQSWIYESQNSYDGQSKTPSDGVPHKFWDETHAFITGAAVEPGDTIMLQKDSANSAAFYNIDVVDLEAPPAPLTQPANSLSITDYGAVANNINVDSAGPISRCMADASSKGMSVWIPQGTFYLDTSINLRPNQITVEGAGMWYSTLYFNPPFPYTTHDNVLVPVSSTIRNLHIDGNATNNTQDAYAINMKGSNWLIDSVWIEHEGPGVWADGMNGTVSNSRLDSLWADGINLNNGSGAQGNDGGTNLTALNNFIRGSGDDGMAINSAEDGTPQQTPMLNTTIINNTIVAPWWANGIGVYGGTLDLVANNLVTDAVKEAGIGAGTFGPQGTPLQTAFISGNTILRGGSLGYGVRYPAINIGQTGSSSPNLANNVILRGNTIVNPMFNGVLVNSTINTEIFNNTVNAPSLTGFEVGSGNGEAVDFSPAQGNAFFFGNTVYNLAPGQTAFSLSVSGFSASQQNNVGPVNP
ncbi:malectin domain-containing carbohydrate-binding protein [Edaphobacter aggregans]|uniref:malectin domain-containing carbohydrate-binding protein n=1 Tax=Edaphobacter aggregans TaxID=570835 RepID=UPI001470783F|nr:malectin domain-containing carbohydrate-binding protein [Edaphobacter aggregans]